MKKIQLDLKVETALSELVEELKALPRGKAGNIGPMPAALGERIVRLWRDSGLSPEDLGSRLGISGTSIRSWSKKRRTKKSRRRVRPKFTEVKVRREVKGLAPEGRVLTLELANGARVHGLSISEIRELVMGGGAR